MIKSPRPGFSAQRSNTECPGDTLLGRVCSIHRRRQVPRNSTPAVSHDTSGETAGAPGDVVFVMCDERVRPIYCFQDVAASAPRAWAAAPSLREMLRSHAAVVGDLCDRDAQVLSQSTDDSLAVVFV